MIIKIENNEGLTATIDNAGQVNGAVRITGEESLVSHLNLILNVHISLLQGMLKVIDKSFILHEEGSVPVLYKASDNYLKNHFIPVECPLFGYKAEIVKE